MAQYRGMSASRFIYFAGDALSIAELSAASLDGHLVGLGEGFMPADAVETPAMRAASLRSLMGETKAASLLTAAWIWGAIPSAPARHSAHRAVAHRLHHVVDRRLVLHDVYLADDARVRLGGVWVSTPLHSLIALVRHAVAAPSPKLSARSTTVSSAAGPPAILLASAQPLEHPAVQAARALVEKGSADPREALAWLATRRRMPGVQASRALLLALSEHLPTPSGYGFEAAIEAAPTAVTAAAPTAVTAAATATTTTTATAAETPRGA